MDNKVPGKGKAVASLVLGIIAIVFAAFFSGIIFMAILAIVLSIVSIVLAISAKKELPENKKGMATAGLVLSIIALVLATIMFIACSLCVAAIGSNAGAIEDALNSIQ